MTVRRLILALALAASVSALGAEPRAGPPPPTPSPEPPPLEGAAGAPNWGSVGALLAPINANVVEVGFGWPGLEGSLRRGIRRELELGGRLSINYGVEGMMGAVVPGLKLQLLARYKFLDNGKISLAARFEPGPLLYFYNSGPVSGCTFDRFGNYVCNRATTTVGGFILPIGARLGIAASGALNVGVSFDLPMWLSFGNVAVLYVPILMGLGAEYFLQSNLLLSFMVKMGPTLTSAPTFNNGAGSAVFTFEGKLGLAYRL